MSYAKPHKISDVQLAFPAALGRLLPSMAEIPPEFRKRDNHWLRWQETWFFEGLSSFPEPKDGIDRADAMRHLTAIQGSFEPKHEHKQAAVAWLASMWLQEPTK